MLSPAIYLVLNGLFFTLRLSGGGSFPRPLKAEEERMYLERCAQGDLEARNVLVEHNLRLVAHIVKKYYAQTGDQDDLISIGTIGLIKGISTFKADKNVRLATYASRCIENEILMHFRSQRKLQGEVSLADTLEAGGEDGSLGRLRPGAEMRGFLPDRTGTGDRMPALRAGRTGPPDPAGDRLPVRHQPVLRIPPRLL